MSLSDKEIRKAIRSSEFRTIPKPARINPSGIDLRIDRDLSLPPHSSVLVGSLESVELPNSWYSAFAVLTSTRGVVRESRNS